MKETIIIRKANDGGDDTSNEMDDEKKVMKDNERGEEEMKY